MPEGFCYASRRVAPIVGRGESNARTKRCDRDFSFPLQRLGRTVRYIAWGPTGSVLRAPLQSATAFAGSPDMPDRHATRSVPVPRNRRARRSEDALAHGA